MYTTFDQYMYFYKKFLLRRWDNAGPEEYVITLLLVGVIGWFMMRKGPKSG
jgi:hypothetical protein